MLTLVFAIALHIDSSRLLARFDPRIALGGTIDAHTPDKPAKVFASRTVRAILSAGLQSLSYRLATELAGEAWHWNPRGTWSSNGEGYWTSSSKLGDSIAVSYGYQLPRRGNTRDQSMNNGYSRIDDGDESTFWKSNPYLYDHPQWILIDLGAAQPVDRIDVVWGEPRAMQFENQYWSGFDPINEPADGKWIPLDQRVTARYFRIWIRGGQPPSAAQGDWRDHAGVAVSEIYVRDGDHDWIRHAPDGTQTVIWVSSTDPWHRATDIDRSIEQPGLDAVFASGLTRGLPMLTPVALLYGTPEDAAAEVAYLRARKYKVTQIEMGEEPDGQNMAPEDYAALYRQWAKAIHSVDPSLQLGGPALQSTRDIIAFWPDESGRTSWMARLLANIDRSDFNFFSFEWYPFDNVCDSPAVQLVEAPHVLDRVLSAWQREGVPREIPWMATEYGWSSYAAQAEVDLPGALFNAEFVADFLARGGAAAYLYGYEPATLYSEKCAQYGALTLFLGPNKVPAFYAAQLMTREWLQSSGVHELYAVSGLPELVRAYAVKRPDGTWSMLLLNIAQSPAVVSGIRGSAIQYSQREYEWHAEGEQSHATRNLPPRRFKAGDSIELPPYSITVVRLQNAGT